MTKPEFEALVSSVINRGTAYDTHIISAVGRAIAWFERNYNFPHMKNSGTFFANTTSPTTIELDIGMKKLRGLWYNNNVTLIDGSPEDLYPEQIERSEARNKPLQAWPEWFVLDFGQALISDGVPTVLAEFGTLAWPGNATIFWRSYRMTHYATFSTLVDHWLLTYATDAVLARTMLNLLPFVRQIEKTEFWRGEFTLALPPVIQMAEQMEYGPQDLQLEYS